ncbi:hypothetical protein BSZ32_16035 [Rubritalea profundi]|uniref:Uncharacterized protein n=1 Tax=Rubritalea profundi TaxID=1658618 RepID=A0A2S7U5X7_9BACT|nr:hypothetical protein BSZ32_16035 [Rubritalea profundi]
MAVAIITVRVIAFLLMSDFESIFYDKIHIDVLGTSFSESRGVMVPVVVSFQAGLAHRLF